jgi:hypothetical protein
MLADMLDRVIAFAARDEAELVRAREEWGDKAGRVFHDDVLYEERTTAFLEWYALERFGSDGKLPASRFLAEGGGGEAAPLDEMDRAWVNALATTHRSLFEVREVKEGEILMDDLVGGGAFSVTERRRLPGVEPSEILEVRLVANPVTPPQILFTRAFQFHPREARPELKRQAELARKAGEVPSELLFRFLRLHLKALRYQHVAADKIYKDG